MAWVWCGVAGFTDCPSSRWEAVGEPGPRETRTATLREQVAAGTLGLANERLCVPPGGERDDVSREHRRKAAPHRSLLRYPHLPMTKLSFELLSI